MFKEGNIVFWENKENGEKVKLMVTHHEVGEENFEGVVLESQNSPFNVGFTGTTWVASFFKDLGKFEEIYISKT